MNPAMRSVANCDALRDSVAYRLFAVIMAMRKKRDIHNPFLFETDAGEYKGEVNTCFRRPENLRDASVTFA